MAAYVDDMIQGLRIPKWLFGKHCHLVADTIEELHTFAHGIGLRRSWYQHKTIPHYDLTAGKRATAVRKGAIEITREQLCQMIQKQRILG